MYDPPCKGNWQTWSLGTVAADFHVIYQCSTGMRNGECRCQVHQPSNAWWDQLSHDAEAGQTCVNEAPLRSALTSGSRPGQAFFCPFCQRSNDEGKLRPSFTKCEKIIISEHAKRASAHLSPWQFSKSQSKVCLVGDFVSRNVTCKEGKPMSCACSVFLLVKRMAVCNFSPMGKGKSSFVL